MISKFTARILLMSLVGVFLQIIPTPAQAAALTDYGLNYKNAYFTVNGGLAPNNSNFQVDTWFRINEWNSTHGEHAIIIGNSGTSNALIIKIQGTNQVYFGQANISAKVFTCSTTWALETWYQLTAVQDTNGQLAWINGASCGEKQSRGNYVSANQLGGQSSPLRLNQNTDISSFRFKYIPSFSTNSSTITPPTYPLSSEAGTSFLFNPQSVSSSMTDTIGYNLTKAGTGTITRSQVILIQQNLLLEASKTSLRYDQTATLSTSGSSGTGAITYSPSGSCTVTGNVLKATGSSGNCTVSATIAADSVYAAKTSNTLTIPLSKGDQQSTMYASQVASSATWNGSAYTAVPTFSTGGSPGTGAVTYTVANGTASGCTLSSNTLSTATLTATTSGTCTITATKAASTNYDSASVQLTFTFIKATSSTGLAISNSSVTYGSALTLTANVSPSTATGTFSFSNNGTPISGCTAVTITSGAATCTTWKPAVGVYTPITVTYSGNTYYATSTSSDVVSLTVTKTPLVVIPDSKTVTFGASAPTYSFTYQGFVNNENSSSSSFTTGLIAPICSASSYSTSSAVSASPMQITCSGGSATNYTFDYSSTSSLTIVKDTPTLSNFSNVPKNFGDSPFTVTAPTVTASVPGTLSYSSATTSVISVSGTTLTVAGGGSSVITATFTPDDSTNYNSATINMTVTVGVGSQSITRTSTSPSSPVKSGTYTPTATASSSLTVVITIAVGSSSVCSISSGTVTFNTVGSCVIEYNQGGNANYSAATQVSETLTISKATPTFSTWSDVSKNFGDSAFTVTAPTVTGSIPGSFSYSSATTSVISVSGTTLTGVGVGSSVITATFTPTDTTNYNSATTFMTVTVGKATPTFSTWSDVSKNFGNSPFTVTAPSVTGSLGGSFSYSSATTSVISVSGTTLTVVGAGSSVITATFTPTDTTNYNSAITTMTVTVGKANQATLSVANQNFWAHQNQSPSLWIPTGGSGTGALEYSVTSGPCTISSGTLYGNPTGPTGPTVCTLTVTKLADTNYNAITSASFTATMAFSFNRVGLALPSAATTATYGTPVVITATSFGQIPGTISFRAAGQTISGCTNKSVTALPWTTTCTWTPSASGATNLTYDWVPSEPNLYHTKTNWIPYKLSTDSLNSTTPVTITVAKIATTNLLALSSATSTYGSVNTITATVSFSGTVAFKSNGTDIAGCESVATTLASQYTAACAWIPTGVGSYSLTAVLTPSNAAAYATATATLDVTVVQGEQTNALAITSTTVIYGSTLSLITSGGDGGGSNSFLVNSGPCTVSGTTLTPTAVGTCMVTATKAANGNYLAASSVSTAITVTPKGLTISGLTGVNKEFDRSLTGTVTGSPSLIGVVGSDNVLLGGTPTFTFVSANAANGITLAASGYTLTGTTAGNYTLTQPTMTANITAKAVRVAATNTTVAFGVPVTSGVTATGVISPDAIGSASYTYTGTGTSTPPTAVGIYTVTPSNAVFSTGSIGNYAISYDTATVTILAKYTITYNANGGVIGSSSTTSADFVVGDNALALPTATREGFNFLGWFTLQSNGVQVSGAYTPSATAILWAHWIQKSLVGVGNSQKIGTITTLANVGNTYSATSSSGTVAVTYAANALPVGTVIDIYQMADSSRASSMISSTNNYVLSLVVAWLTPASTVPLLSANDALTMVITDSAIKKGAKVYSLVGSDSTLLGTATADGSVTVRILEDPEVYIAITKPDAPTGVSATSGGNATTAVSWTAPSDGGSPITLYTATSNAGQTCSSATTSCSITGLTNGTAYTFTVTATNTIGVSDPSAPSSAVTPAAPVVTARTSGSSGGGGGGSTYVAPTSEPIATVDPAVAAAAAAVAKALAEKAATEAKLAAEAKALADAKAAADKKAADEAELAAIIKALQEQAAAEAAALAAAKKAADELRIAEELRIAQEKADAALKAAAEKKALEDAAAAALLAAKKIVPQVSLYMVSSKLKLSAYDTAYLKKYTSQLAPTAKVTCVGYIYSKNTTYAKAKALAQSQAKAVCALIKKEKKTITTATVLYPATKAPKAAAGSKYVAVSYRIDSFKK